MQTQRQRSDGSQRINLSANLVSSQIKTNGGGLHLNHIKRMSGVRLSSAIRKRGGKEDLQAQLGADGRTGGFFAFCWGCCWTWSSALSPCLGGCGAQTRRGAVAAQKDNFPTRELQAWEKIQRTCFTWDILERMGGGGNSQDFFLFSWNKWSAYNHKVFFTQNVCNDFYGRQLAALSNYKFCVQCRHLQHIFKCTFIV